MSGESAAGRPPETLGYTRAVSATMPAQRGRFITIEGPEGAGKTSHAGRLREHVKGIGLEVLVTREPGGTTIGERLRELLLHGPGGTSDPRTDALLFSAARAQLVREVIQPALARGAVIISTRYADSTLAYQGFGAGLSVEDLRAIERFATGGLVPDRTILLDLPVEVGLARKLGTEITRFEREFDLDFHRRVRDGFLRLAAGQPGRFVVVDAARDEPEVFDDVRAAVAGLLGTENERRPERHRPGAEPERDAVRIDP